MRNWLETSLFVGAIVLATTLAVSHTASAVTSIVLEVDPSTAYSGLALLAGGVFLLFERRRRSRRR